MPRSRDVQCADCDQKLSLFERRGEVFDLATGDKVDAERCECGGLLIGRISGGARTIDQGGVAGVGVTYPYYDRMLLCDVRSAAHRRQLCRERGLVPVEGDLTDRDFKVGFAEDERKLANYRDYCTRLEDDPQYRNFRELRDKGYLEDQKQAVRES